MISNCDFNSVVVPYGYCLVKDSDGMECILREDTGEVLPVRYYAGTDDSYLVTGRTREIQEERRRVERERAKRNEEHDIKVSYLKSVHDDLGNFIWIMENEFKDLTPQSVTRLLYLATYLTYDGDKRGGGKRENLLMKNGAPIRYEDLQDLLNVTRNTVKQFWKEVSPKYLHTDSAGNIHVSDKESFIKGGIRRYTETAYFRGYIEGIRALYESAYRGDHKKLGRIFQLLPFINSEYNVICSNPHETSVENVKPMTVNEIGARLGLEREYTVKFFREVCSIRFNTKYGKRPFIGVVRCGNEPFGQGKVVVNPCVLYRGTNYTKVEGYELFFK